LQTKWLDNTSHFLLYGPTMNEAKHIKDIPVGVLLIVLAQFVFYLALYLAHFPNFWEMLGIVCFTLVSTDMVQYGIKLIKGYNYDPNE
jgi:hypothetical protein